MNLIRVSSRLLRAPALVKLTPGKRSAFYLDQDWMPGPYPKTEAERLAAAKKYNLLPEEYEPYDPVKWEFAFGDYPHLPNICYEDKNPYYAYDHLVHRHNYNEVFHVNYLLYNEWGPSLNYEGDDIPYYKILFIYFVCMAVVYCYVWLGQRFEAITFFKPMQTPFLGETHYHYPSSKLEMYE